MVVLDGCLLMASENITAKIPAITGVTDVFEALNPVVKLAFGRITHLDISKKSYLVDC